MARQVIRRDAQHLRDLVAGLRRLPRAQRDDRREIAVAQVLRHRLAHRLELHARRREVALVDERADEVGPRRGVVGLDRDDLLQHLRRVGAALVGEQQVRLQRQRLDRARMLDQRGVDDAPRAGEVAPQRREPRLAGARHRIAGTRLERRAERGARRVEFAEREMRDADRRLQSRASFRIGGVLVAELVRPPCAAVPSRAAPARARGDTRSAG